MPLLWLSISFIAGIYLGSITNATVFEWLFLSLFSLPLFLIPSISRWLIIDHAKITRGFISLFNPLSLRVFLIPYNKLRSIKLGISFPWLLIFLCLGAARYVGSLPVFSDGLASQFNDQGDILDVEGVVVDYPDSRDLYTSLVVEIDQIKIDGETWKSTSGKILARLGVGGDWAYGDRVKLTGYLVTPGEDEAFSYKDYLSRQGIHSLFITTQSLRMKKGQANPLLALLFRFRNHLLNIVYQIYPDPEASLLAGILLGLERGMPENLVKAFQVTGTAHVIAISGFNMALLSGICTSFFVRWTGRNRGAILAVTSIALYTILVGAQAAVVRAAIMGCLSVFAGQAGRRQNGLNSLAFVAAVMSGFQPFVLWDVGFQLSLTATLGLVVFGDSWTNKFIELITPYIGSNKALFIAGPVGEYGLMTLAAQLMTLPVIVFHFGRISLVSMIANPLILPVQPVVMVLGGASLLLGLVYLPLARIAAYGVWPFAAFTNRIVEQFSNLPYAEFQFAPINLLFPVIFYGFILLWLVAHSKIREILVKVRPGFGLVILVVVTIQVWRSLLSSSDGLLHVTILDVNPGEISGEAILLHTPEDRYVLINGGPSLNQLSDALGRRLSNRGDNLDTMVIAGIEEGQIQSLPRLIARYIPGKVIWAGETHANYASRYLYEALLAQDKLPQKAQTGMYLDLGDGARLDFLDVRPRGATMLLSWERFRMLLPIGLDFNSLDTFRQESAIGPVNVLLLAGNGYAPLNPYDWIEALRPDLILLSVALRDSRGLPDDDVLSTLDNYSLLRTDLNGWIELETDGTNYWVEIEKQITY